MPSVIIVTKHGKFKTLLTELLVSTPYDILDASPNSSPVHLKTMTPELEAVFIGNNSQSKSEFFNVIDRFRQTFPTISIIAVAGNHDIRFVVQTMQAGADTYLVESDLNSPSLVAAIDEARKTSSHRDHKPTSPNSELAIIQIDDLVINNQKLNVSFQENLLDLSPTEFEILSHLARSAGQVVTFEELVFRVYDLQTDREQARRTLAAHISNLRGKLREAGAKNYLVNRRGRGYLIEREAATFSLPDYQHVEHYKQALEMLTAQIPNIAICLYDHDRNIIVNKGQIIIGQADEPEDQPSTAFSFAERHANFENQIDAVFDEKTSHLEHESQGNHYTIDLLPIISTNGDIPMGMILVQDISTFKQLDSLVSGEIEELTSKIMTQVTSEIRTTLTTLQTSTDLLLRYRERISESEQATRLNQIQAHVNDLVEYFEAISTLSQTFSSRQR